MSHAGTRTRRLMGSAIVTLVLLGGLVVIQTPDLRGAAVATPTPLAYLPLVAQAEPTTMHTAPPNSTTTPSATPSATFTPPACSWAYPIGIDASLLDANGFVPPTEPAELPYYGLYSDGTYTNKTQRRLYRYGEFGTPILNYHFLTWQGGTTDFDAFSAAISGTGTLEQGFDEVVPWPDPNSAPPSGYPLLPHELTVGDWVAGFDGTANGPRVYAAFNDHVIHHTVLSLPIFDRIVGINTSEAIHVARVGNFLVRWFDKSGNYLDLVYLGEASPLRCSTSSTITPTATSPSIFTVTPHFSTVTPTPTPTETPTASPTGTLTPQAMTLSITNFYFAPANGTNVRPISIKAHLTRNGTPFDGASVNGIVDRGTGPLAVTLASIGNGDYTVCNIGSWTGTGAAPLLSLTAVDGVGNSASATSSSPISIKFPECP